MGLTPVVVDAMGGDHGPAEVVRGAVRAWREHGVPVILVGRAEVVRRELRRLDAGGHGPGDANGRIEVVHAAEAVPMAGAGALCPPDSSLTVGFDLVRRGLGGALVSAGSTGAIVASALRRLGAFGPILRPALAVALPSVSGAVTVLVDAGATPDATPAMLAQFALLGAAYARFVPGVADPTVGLLSIGAEPGKGNRLVRAAAERLRRLPIRFHGNVEGHDVLSGRVDVIVTDGFTGNVVLKNVEGCVRSVLAMTAARGAAPEGLREVARRFAPETHGGAALLGPAGTVVVAHGSARAVTIARACAVARDLVEGGAMARIAEAVTAGPVRAGMRPAT